MEFFLKVFLAILIGFFWGAVVSFSEKLLREPLGFDRFAVFTAFSSLFIFNAFISEGWNLFTFYFLNEMTIYELVRVNEANLWIYFIVKMSSFVVGWFFATFACKHIFDIQFPRI